jgi:hypothetical protein
MVERLQVYIPKVAENLLRIVVDSKGDWVRHNDYARLQEQLEAVTAKKISLQDDVIPGLIHRAEAAEARAARLEADNSRLRQAAAYFIDRLKSAWLGKIVRDMDEAEAAWIAALDVKEAG